MILTHAHFDHAANANKIKEKYKTTVIVQKDEAIYLANGDNILPNGTTIFTKPIVNVEIVLDSHPAQSANVWDRIEMSLNMDGSPTKIVWKFGDWRELECPGRSCTDVSQVYEVPWEYVIIASIFYENMPMVEWKINLVVK